MRRNLVVDTHRGKLEGHARAALLQPVYRAAEDAPPISKTSHVHECSAVNLLDEPGDRGLRG